MSLGSSQVNIPFVTTDQMREVDRAMVEDYGISLLQMMENAGRGRRIWQEADSWMVIPVASVVWSWREQEATEGVAWYVLDVSTCGARMCVYG